MLARQHQYHPSFMASGMKQELFTVEHCPPCVELHECHTTLTLHHHSVSTAGTPYEGGLFKMKLVLGKDFPAAPPQGYCESTLYVMSLWANEFLLGIEVLYLEQSLCVVRYGD